MADKQYRFYHCVLYPDAENYVCSDVLNLAMSKYSEVAYILHDKDVYEDEILDDDGNVIHCKGELKKSHYHLVFRTTPRFPKAISNALGVPLNDIEFGKGSFEHCVRYLVHSDNPHKFQYDISDIITNIVDIDKFFYEVDEGSQVMDLVNYKNSGVSYKELGLYAQQKHCWSALRRNLTFIKLCNDEHFTKERERSIAYYDALQEAREIIYDKLIKEGNFSTSAFEQISLDLDKEFFNEK